MAEDTSFTTDVVVETWKCLQEYISEKDKVRAGQHFLRTLQDNGIEEETLEALAEADDLMEELIDDVMEDPLYEEGDDGDYDDDGDDDYN